MTTKPRAPDGFQRTFLVDVAPEAVWEALTRLRSDDRRADTVEYRIPGFEARCTVLEQEPGRWLRLKKAEEPCAGTEIALGLEHAGSGTRVTVVQSGFGPWLPDVIETFGMVWNMIVADLKLFLERGVSLRTHLFEEPPPAVALGCEVRDQLDGLAVARVAAEGFAARAGIQADDLLLKLNGVRLLNGLQLMNLMRMCPAGTELEAVWARGSDLMRGRASL